MESIGTPDQWGVYVPCDNPEDARALARILANDIDGAVHVLRIHGGEHAT